MSLSVTERARDLFCHTTVNNGLVQHRSFKPVQLQLRKVLDFQSESESCKALFTALVAMPIQFSTSEKASSASGSVLLSHSVVMQ